MERRAGYRNAGCFAVESADDALLPASGDPDDELSAVVRLSVFPGFERLLIDFGL